MNIFKKKRSKLSRRITWRVILIVSFINVLIIGAIIFFFFVISTMISGMRASYVIDGLNRQFESMHKAEQVFQPTSFNKPSRKWRKPPGRNSMWIPPVIPKKTMRRTITR